jgi:shikimate 5-dehydrogenase
MYFIGVSTGQSAIRKVFPLWMVALGREEVVLEGIDLKLHDDPAVYRQTVTKIKHNPLALGALVTTHKIDLMEAAHDMFDYLDPYAKLCGEISCIAKRDGRLEGYAKDPIAAGLTLDTMLGAGYFGRTGGQVLCFGAGGSARAIALHFINKAHATDRPPRFVVVNRSKPRLDRLKAMVQRLDTHIAFEFVCNDDPRRNDEIMASMPPGTLIINATGMGKDLPGSPITGRAPFPENGIAWELNYRGELLFLHQALAQMRTRNLRVEDGWLYFLHGWTQVIAQVLHTPITGALFDRLASIAERIRPQPARGR